MAPRCKGDQIVNRRAYVEMVEERRNKVQEGLVCTSVTVSFLYSR